MRILLALLGTVSAGCSQLPEHPVDGWNTDVVGVSEAQLNADYWIARAPAARRLLMSRAEIEAFNRHAYAADDTLVSLAEFPRQLAATDVHAMVTGISQRSSYDRYYSDGSLVGDSDYAGYEAALNLDALPANVTTQYGLVVTRSDMRTFPTSDRVISSADSVDLDRFQEHGLFPGEAVAVLHESRDGLWLFVQSYNYAAWVQSDTVAIGARDEVLGFLDTDDFLVVTESKVHTSYNPRVPALSERQLDMGVRLPLATPADVGHNLYGQNPFASYVVRLPLRRDDGSLSFDYALIPRSEGVHAGYLPYTRENVIRQAFGFLGERYGWGHSYNGRDCTGFVSEVYKTFGLLMPRNSGDQGSSVIGDNRRFDETAGDDEKVRTLDAAAPGALVYIPGHVAMIIGEDAGQPYVIHDVAGLRYQRDDGSQYRGVLHGVSVTPLLPMRVSEEQRYLDRIYNIKTIK